MSLHTRLYMTTWSDAASAQRHDVAVLTYTINLFLSATMVIDLTSTLSSVLSLARVATNSDNIGTVNNQDCDEIAKAGSWLLKGMKSRLVGVMTSVQKTRLSLVSGHSASSHSLAFTWRWNSCRRSNIAWSISITSGIRQALYLLPPSSVATSSLWQWSLSHGLSATTIDRATVNGLRLLTYQT